MRLTRSGKSFTRDAHNSATDFAHPTIAAPDRLLDVANCIFAMTKSRHARTEMAVEANSAPWPCARPRSERAARAKRSGHPLRLAHRHRGADQSGAPHSPIAGDRECAAPARR